MVQHVEAEIARNEGVLSEAAMQEYRDALRAYQNLRGTLGRAREADASTSSTSQVIHDYVA